MVEFALILPVVMSLVLGIITGGMAYERKLAMSDAVREAARFGATLPTSTSGWTTKVIARATDLSAGDLASSQVCVALQKDGVDVSGYVSPSPCPFTGAPTLTTTSGCVVKVWAERSTARPPGDKLQAMFFSVNLKLTAKAAARFEGTC